MITHLVRLAALGVAGAFIMSGPTFAQELPRSGSFTAYFVHVNPAPFPPVPLGDGRIMIPLTFVTSLANAAGSGLLHNVRGSCVGIQTVNPTAGNFEVQGTCAFQDPAGDWIYESFHSDGVTPLAGGTTIGTFLGGTGKYAGITGTVTLTPYGLTTGALGLTQVVGQQVGTYQLP